MKDPGKMTRLVNMQLVQMVDHKMSKRRSGKGVDGDYQSKQFIDEKYLQPSYYQCKQFIDYQSKQFINKWAGGSAECNKKGGEWLELGNEKKK